MNSLSKPQAFLEKTNLLTFTLNHICQLSTFKDLDEIGENILSLQVVKNVVSCNQYSNEILGLLTVCNEDLGILQREPEEFEEFLPTYNVFIKQMIEVRDMVESAKEEGDLNTHSYLRELMKWKEKISQINENAFLIYLFWATYLTGEPTLN